MEELRDHKIKTLAQVLRKGLSRLKKNFDHIPPLAKTKLEHIYPIYVHVIIYKLYMYYSLTIYIVYRQNKDFKSKLQQKGSACSQSFFT